MRVFPLVVAISLAACAGNHNKQLETRLAAVEAAQNKTDFEVRAALARLDATVLALAGKVGEVTDPTERVDELIEAIADVQRRLDALEAGKPPGAPVPPPHVRREPDPTKVYGVPIAGSPVRGKPDALVTIVRAGEYACPYCERVRDTLDQLMTAYPDDVRIVYKQFIVHPQLAYAPAYGACAAHKQGKFWEMDKLLWEKTFANREFEPAQIEALASSLGLDMSRYRADVAGGCVKQVADEMALMTKFGVGATPVFFINGRYLAGAQPFDAFKTLIDEELAKAQAAVKKGTKKKKYYDQIVIKKGLPALEPTAP
jgi:protein-disulfide isomerase